MIFIITVIVFIALILFIDFIVLLIFDKQTIKTIPYNNTQNNNTSSITNKQTSSTDINVDDPTINSVAYGDNNINPDLLQMPYHSDKPINCSTLTMKDCLNTSTCEYITSSQEFIESKCVSKDDKQNIEGLKTYTNDDYTRALIANDNLYRNITTPVIN